MDEKTKRIWDEISKKMRPTRKKLTASSIKRSLLDDLKAEEEIIWILQKHWSDAEINPARINDNEKGCF